MIQDPSQPAKITYPLFNVLDLTVYATTAIMEGKASAKLTWISCRVKVYSAKGARFMIAEVGISTEYLLTGHGKNTE